MNRLRLFHWIRDKIQEFPYWHCRQEIQDVLPSAKLCIAWQVHTQPHFLATVRQVRQALVDAVLVFLDFAVEAYGVLEIGADQDAFASYPHLPCNDLASVVLAVTSDGSLEAFAHEVDMAALDYLAHLPPSTSTYQNVDFQAVVVGFQAVVDA